MDVIITAIGDFIWTSSCGIVNLCLSSGLSALVVFVTFLCGILASAFYKYTIHRERMLTATEITYLDVTDDINLSSKIDDTEEEIQTKQINDIYHLLNDDDLTTTDFVEQLKMYGVQIDDNFELEVF